MNGSLCRRMLCWIVIMIAGTAAGAAAPVDWLHLAPECSPTEITTGDGEEPQIIYCGGAGTFAFGRRGLRYPPGKCSPLAVGSETPPIVPYEQTPRLPPAFPCAQGSCFHHAPGHPWVAVVDWQTEHGWSVAATLQEASDQSVEVLLYDLNDVGAIATLAPSVSDLHVLVQLCALEEDLQAHPLDRPLAVNMSFGRHAMGDPCLQSGTSLGCSVSHVLSHLAAQGVLPVAAAGNHREMLFPATSQGVVSAGALDLAYFQQTGEIRPSTQTPSNASALMLGYGIHLSTGDSTWPAPPGSSYAAALFTGWLGGTLAGGGHLPDPIRPPVSRWTPAVTAAPANGLVLTLNGAPLAGSGLAGPRRLLDRAMGASASAPPVDAILQLTISAPPRPKLSVLYADSGNSPQPGVCPCVPCGGGGGGYGGHGQQGMAVEGSDTVVLDLSSSVALPPQMELVRVFLRVGNAVYAFDRSGDSDLLAAIAAGHVRGLALTGVGDILHAGEQPSLVLAVNVGGISYWHEVPIALPSQPLP
jgi:hypothetical protein